ncbi:ABC transporter transmembrane region domain-containing protein [Ditylenchus destructor]|uniref:ABC transporter transmembrane region domain-containing protein n=1 Tax=Ditylenchus destructor TaxID=166010 RepID=A0AAD4MV02_9BILA|nr:ABC transporter transmembrane region domain-containing protein [Ditylenchus destructor]
MGPRRFRRSEALGLIVAYCIIDTLMTLFGLAWNSNISMENIKRALVLHSYNFKSSALEFLIICFLRDFALLTVAISVYFNPHRGPKLCKQFANVTFAVIMAMAAFSPAKLLGFYENGESFHWPVGHWILVVWSVVASLLCLVIWTSVLCNVKEHISREELQERQNIETDQVDKAKEAERRDALVAMFKIVKFMAMEWRYYAAAFFFLILYAASTAFAPYYTGQVIATVFDPEGTHEKLHRAVAIMALLSLSSAIFGGFRGGFFVYSDNRVERRVRDKLFRTLVKQEIGFFDETPTGQICSRIASDCEVMTSIMGLYTNIFTRNSIMLVSSLVLMFTLSWRLTLVTFVLLPINYFVNRTFGMLYDTLTEEKQKATAKSNEIAEEVLSAIRTVKSFACENFEADRYLKSLDKVLVVQKKIAFGVLGYEISSEVLQASMVTAVLFYGGHLVIEKKVESGLLVSFMLYQFQLVMNLFQLSYVWNGVMQAVGASRKVMEWIERQPKIVNRGQYKPEIVKGHIEFRNVKFTYPTRPDKTVLQDVSFTVEPGQVVALVGPSGGGKSSCIGMFEHFYEPDSGEVLLDGVPIREYDHKFLHTKPVLYARSVEENIGYGYPTADKESIQNAAKLANAHEFITDTQNGYETSVGEKGSQMSGGQKQRIAIARALVRDPVILLLDEATSALDTESERLVQEAIQKSLKGRTVLLIAHRLSTVENADKIVVISGGRVVQQGVHKDLVQQDGTYKLLVQRQMIGLDQSPALPSVAVRPNASQAREISKSFKEAHHRTHNFGSFQANSLP